MMHLYPLIHKRAGDKLVPVAVPIISFTTHNRQTAPFGFPFQSLYALAVERRFRQLIVIDRPLRAVITGVPWAATEFIAKIEIGNPSILERSLQRFAIKLRSVPAIGLTTGIYQHLNHLQT